MVWGNCGMCEETIETSVKIDGVTEACWNSETKIMTVSYDTSKISLDQIHKNIAGVGYDTEKYTGVEYIEPRIYLCLEAVLIICKF